MLLMAFKIMTNVEIKTFQMKNQLKNSITNVEKNTLESISLCQKILLKEFLGNERKFELWNLFLDMITDNRCFHIPKF